MDKTIKLILSILICQSAGIIGSFFTVPSVSTWYVDLVKPSFSPPNWIFGPAWILLYTLMGVSLFLIWLALAKAEGLRGKMIKIALAIFALQLLLNTGWSIIFFGLKNPFWAFVEILFLWLAILLTIVIFGKISKPTVFLLVPYILWVTFAAFLNYSVWQLNTGEASISYPAADINICQNNSCVHPGYPEYQFASCLKEGKGNRVF